MQLHLHHSFHSSFFMLCRILFFHFLERSQLSISSIGMSYLATESGYFFPHSSTSSKLTVSFFVISCPWFYSKSLISPKRFSINFCCFVNLFSLPLYKILSFTFSANVNVVILTAISFSISANITNLS